MNIAAEIKRQREARGLTQEQLAARMHVSQQSVARLESLENETYTVRSLERVAEALGKRLTITFTDP